MEDRDVEAQLLEGSEGETLQEKPSDLWSIEKILLTKQVDIGLQYEEQNMSNSEQATGRSLPIHKLAERVHEAREKQEITGSIAGWRLLATGSNNNNGYFGAAFRNQHSDEVAVVHIANNSWFPPFRILKLVWYKSLSSSAMTFSDKVKEKTGSIPYSTANRQGVWLAEITQYSTNELKIAQQANKSLLFVKTDIDSQPKPLYVEADNNLTLSDEGFAENINTEPIVREEYLNMDPFPEVYDMAFLANAAYCEEEVLKEMNLPEGWQFLTAAYNKSWLNLYFGAAFWNSKQHQVVIAHRGTVLYPIKYLLATFLVTDAIGIKYSRCVPQVRSAVTFAEIVREKLENKPTVKLSFTGHSLGGWLSQITTFSVQYLRPQEHKGKTRFMFNKDKVEDCHPHTVAFESPGCRDMLVKMKKELAPGAGVCRKFKDRLNITVYLSPPNQINTLNTHTGTVYTFKKEKFEFANDPRKFYRLFETHKMEHIVKAFKYNPNHSELIQEVIEFRGRKRNTQSYDDTVCSLRLFSKQELYFVNRCQSLEANNDVQAPTEYIDKLRTVTLSLEQYHLKHDNAENLKGIVKHVKQGMALVKDEYLSYLNRCTLPVYHDDLHILDDFGLETFLSSDSRILHITTKNTAVISGIANILRHCEAKAIYLTWQKFVDVLKVVDIYTIFKMANLIILTEHDNPISPSSPLLSDIVEHVNDTVDVKCIIVSKNNKDLFESHVDKKVQKKTVNIECLRLNDVSSDKLLNERLNQRKPDISSLDVFYQNIEERISIDNVHRVLQNENTKIFINCLSEDEVESLESQFAEAKVKHNLGDKGMDCFKKFCAENPQNKAIWLEGKDSVWVCKCIYNCDLCISRQLKGRWFMKWEAIMKALLKREITDTCIIITKEKSAVEDKLHGVDNVYIETSREKALKLSLEKSKTVTSAVHILKFVKPDLLEWDSSTLSIDNLQPYILQENDNSSFLNEDEFISKTSKTEIISDEPGMGKTTTFTKLLYKITNHAAIRFDLKSCIESISNLSDNITLSEVIRFLFNHVTVGLSLPCITVSLTQNALESVLQNDSKYLVLLFDGFDEIPEKLELHVKLLNLLQFLSQKTTAKVWITTRTHYLSVLQKKLPVCATTFRKIPVEEQKRYLKIHWKTVLELQLDKWDEPEEQDLDKYTDRLYQTTSEILDKSVTEFMGIPLQMRMLSEVARPRSSTMKSYDFKVNNVSLLYEKFIDLKFEIYFKQKAPLQDEHKEKSMKKTLFDDLEKLAYRNHFDAAADADVSSNEYQRLGLTRQTGTEFIHRTFQEYFCAHKIATYVAGECISPMSTEFFLRKIMLEEQFKVIRLFLNHFLMKRQNKVNENLRKDIDSIWKEARHKLFDPAGCSCLTISAREGHEYLTKFLVNAAGDNAVKLLALQNKSCETSLAVAITWKHKKIVKAIKDALGSETTWNEIVKATVFENITQGASSKQITMSFESNLHKRNFFRFHWGIDCTDSLAAIDYLLNAEGRVQELVLSSEAFKGMALIVAACYGRIDVVRFLTSKMKYLDFSDKYGRTALHIAALQGALEVVNLLLEKGARPHLLDYDHKSFLHYALQHTTTRESIPLLLNSVKVAFDYLENNNLDRKKVFGNTLLHYALHYYKNNPDTVELFEGLLRKLAEHEVDVNGTDSRGRTPIMHACRKLLLGSVQYLIGKKADATVADSNGRTALHYTMDSNGSGLMDKKPNPEFVDRQNNVIPAIVDLLLENGADINATDSQGVTPLALGVKISSVVVEHLISKDPIVMAKDNNNRTVLHYALYKTSTSDILSIVEVLVKNDVSINDPDRDGVTPLGIACHGLLYPVVEYLTCKKADVNIRDNKERTELHKTLNHDVYLYQNYTENIPEIVEVLVENGATTNTADAQGVTQLAIASKTYPDVIEYLINRKADVGATDKSKRTVLHYALDHDAHAYERYTENILIVLDVLIKHGADVNSPDNKGVTPLVLASKALSYKTVKYLLSKGANSECNALHCILNITKDMYKGYKDIPKIVGALLERDVNINAVDSTGATPLALACKLLSQEVVQELISKRANVHVRDKDSKTVLHYVLSQDPYIDENYIDSIPKIVKILVDKAPDIVNVADEQGVTPLALASKAISKGSVEYLIEKGGVVTAVDKKRRTTLHYALDHPVYVHELYAEKILGIVEALTKPGGSADVHASDEEGVTPLALASKALSLKAVEHLINQHNNLTDDDGKRIIASVLNHDIRICKSYGEDILKIVKALIEKCTNIANSDALLGLACKSLLPEVVEFLLLQQNRNEAYDTALLSALDHANDVYKEYPDVILKVVKLLVEKGANVNSSDTTGITPLAFASKALSLDVVKYLISRQANVNATTEHGTTVIHYALSDDAYLFKDDPNVVLEVVKILVEKGAKFEVPDKQGITAFDLAKLSWPSVHTYLSKVLSVQSESTSNS